MAYVTKPFTCSEWTRSGLWALGENVDYVPSLSILDSSAVEIEHRIELHEKLGIPLMLRDFHKSDKWRTDILGPGWIAEHYGEEGENSSHIYPTTLDSVSL